MPYPNEHAARVRDPGSFEPDSIRSKKLKGGVRLILGKLKGGNGSMIVQAYRFSVDNFTVEQAKKWLEDNKVKFIKFEPAKSVSESEGNMENKIAHAGVIGMKWGHRQDGVDSKSAAKIRERMTNQKNKKDTEGSTDYKTAAKLREKQIHEMSNEELSTVIKRMDLQKRYKDLNPTKATKGKKAAKEVLSTIGQVSAGVTGVIFLAGIGNALMKKVAGRNIAKEVAEGLNAAIRG